MAPQKPAANDKAPKAKKSPTDKQSKDKVVKRPARGYHTFRNGMLNVTPKGGEKDIVKANQQSPLLRLPAEVRNMIWEFALGRRLYEIKPRKVYGRRTYPRGDPSEVSLLRVCRQIYAEAASIPLRQNTFLIADPLQPEACLSTFKCYQRRQITSLRFECSMPYPVAYLLEAMDWLFFILKSSMYLPGLKKLVFCICRDPKIYTFDRQRIENRIRRQIGTLSSKMILDFEFE